MFEKIAIGGLLLALVATGKYALDLKKDRDGLVQENIEYQKKNPIRQGYLLGYGDYNLKSFDSGKTWYMFNGDWTKVIGEADKVKPGLGQALGAWDAISARAEGGNPISLESKDDLGLLKSAGITATKKDEK